MGTTPRTLRHRADVEPTIVWLNSAHAYHLTAMHWIQAVVDRLHGLAHLLVDQTRDADDLTHQPALRHIGTEISRDNEMEGTLT